MAVEDVTCGKENEARDFVAISTIPSSKMESVEERNFCADRNGNENAVNEENEVRDSASQFNIPCGKVENTKLYNDKNVMQGELPKLMVFYKEKDHVAKDVCIDEGVPFKDKIIIESGNDDGLCTFFLSDENKIGDVTKEREDSKLLSSNGSKSSSENDYNKDDIQVWGTKEEEIDMESLLADALKSLLENHLVDDIGEKSLKSFLESPNADGNEVQQQFVQIPCSVSECKAAPSLVSTTKVSNKSSPVDDLSYNSKAECATITFDSSKPTASNKDDDVAPLKTDSVPASHEGSISDISAVGSEIQNGQGESSFSMAGLITYSGPMTYSGNVSLRSDSSTTSTRSFAFPIIQSEWNSSPIRMAKADRRHRGWRQGLLCCRF
ncbi:hypothetical protein Vadar_000488 [Vaccinium darrowii]|uniref:Uncharacterized protein n=1 Tax=Vaccinium darrowii TaxID=229202 RepID=A0ACB7WW81_9ERIC|nr:hypothetical protein Vadar_000488 [Vaccinium darrowii]